MKYKKCIMILILAICVLTGVTGVCAGDADDASPAGEDDALAMSQDDEILTATDDGETIGETDNGTFAALDSKIRTSVDSTIKLENNYAYEGSGFDEGIRIEMPDITIDGQGHTIDGKGQVRVFRVLADNVTIKNIRFINAHTGGNGGAIEWYSEGELFNASNGTVSDCDFENCSSDNNGGAICWAFSEYGSVSACSFVNCRANHVGGAIYWQERGHGSISGSSFVNCRANDGGAIYLSWADPSSISLCTFENNSASDCADIYAWQSTNIVADSCIFKSGPGTVMFDVNIVSPILKVDDFITTHYSEERLTFNLTSNGGIPIHGANLTVKLYKGEVLNDTFYCLNDDGWAVDLHSGIYSAVFDTEYGGFEPIKRTIKVTDGTTFWDLNNAINGDSAGEITLDRDYAYNETTDEELDGGISITRPITINGNGHIIDAKGLARIFVVSSGDVVIRNITFANGHFSGNGGAIVWYGSNGRISDSNFIKCSALNFGGAIDIYGSSNGVLYNCNFVDCRTGGSGGAIYESSTGFWNISSCSFNNCSVNNEGGAITGSSKDIMVSDCIFVDCRAVNDGIITLLEDNGLISGCIFINNTALEAIVNYRNQATSKNLTIVNNIFLNNAGPAIGFNATISDYNIDYNWFEDTATKIIVPEYRNVSPDVILFLNATFDSEMIILRPSDITFKLYAYDAVSKTVSEYDNTLLKPINMTLAATIGNCVPSVVALGNPVKYFPDTSGEGRVTATIENVQYAIDFKVGLIDPKLSFDSMTLPFTENFALTLNYNETATGKVNITLKGKNADFEFKNVELNRTIALPGIGLDAYDVIVKYSGDDFFLNATATGTLIFTDGTTFWDLNRTINSNGAGEITLDRDYVFNESVDSGFRNGILIDREVVINGNGHSIDAKQGAKMFHVRGDNVTIRNVTFVNGNSVTGLSGAVYWEGRNGAIFDSVFLNNTGLTGGAIRWDGEDGRVMDCVFTSNSAREGGAINWHGGSNGIISGSLFIGNTGENGIITFNNHVQGNNLTIKDNIFLNNTGDAISFNMSDATSKIICNWFGNTADNLDVGPSIVNAVEEVWLFLNVTSDSSVIPSFGTADITFRLYAYNMTSKTVSEYDNSLLKLANLTITSTKGYVDKGVVNLGESIKYTATGVGRGGVTATIGDFSYAIEFENVKADSGLVLYNQSVTYGHIVTLSIGHDSRATGNVNITLAGKKQVRDYFDRSLALPIEIITLPADEYNVTVKYSGDELFLPATVNATLVVNRASSGINVSVSPEFDVGESITVTLSWINSTGNVSLTINDLSYPIVDKKVVIADGLAGGIYVVRAVLEGDDNYNASESSATFKVNRFSSNVSVDVNETSIIAGQSLKINATLTPNVGNLLYATSDESIVGVDENGTITARNGGVAVITVSFNGNENYTASNATVTVTVKKIATALAAADVTTTYNVNKYLVITLTDSSGKPLAGEKISINLNGVKTYMTDNNGQVKVSTRALSAKIYNVNVAFSGNAKYGASSKDVKVTVNKATNPLKVKAKTVKVKFKKLKKKAQKLKVTKVVKFTKKGQGTLTYKKVKGNKKISINKKTGKVTIKKGLRKGTYKVKMKIRAKGNANYKPSAFKTLVFKIKIK